MAPLPPLEQLVDHLDACVKDGTYEAAKRLEALVAPIVPDAVPRLDGSFRRGLGWDSETYDLYAVVNRLAERPHGWAACALLSLHRVGYVREAAVRALGRLSEPRAVPYLLVRLNDWVPQVRTVAFTALGAYLAPVFASQLIGSLPVLLALQRQGRGNHRAVIDAVERLLASPACAGALASGCRALDRTVRHQCFRLAAAAPAADAAAVLGDAVRDRDPSIRLWAVDQAARVLDPVAALVPMWAPPPRPAISAPQARALLAQAFADRSLQVRRRALRSLDDGLPTAELIPLVEKGLLDESTPVRWQARTLRRHVGALDLAAFYRRALAEAGTLPRLRGALRGLGESGTPADVPTLTSYLAADRISVRRAAVRALGDLEPLSTVEPFLDLLAGAQPGLSTEARRTLAPRLPHVPVARLATIVRSGNLPAHARKNALSLAGALSKWDALPLLLHGAADDHAEIAARGRLLLHAWNQRYNRSFVQPLQSQLADAEVELARLPAGLRHQALAADIEHILMIMRRA